jgi:hypothetical protein
MGGSFAFMCVTTIVYLVYRDRSDEEMLRSKQKGLSEDDRKANIIVSVFGEPKQQLSGGDSNSTGMVVDCTGWLDLTGGIICSRKQAASIVDIHQHTFIHLHIYSCIYIFHFYLFTCYLYI